MLGRGLVTYWFYATNTLNNLKLHLLFLNYCEVFFRTAVQTGISNQFRWDEHDYAIAHTVFAIFLIFRQADSRCTDVQPPMHRCTELLRVSIGSHNFRFLMHHLIHTFNS